MTSNIFRSQRVRLAALSKEDAPIISRWYADSELLRLFDMIPAYPKDAASIEQWINSRKDNSTTFTFGIRVVDTDTLIGFLELDGIIWSSQSCWLGIAIGERDYWGKGYGSETMRLALNYAFGELNMHRVQLTVFTYNERAIALYEKLGFKREGVHRESVYRDGKRYDMYLYGMLRHEWTSQERVDNQ